MTLNNERSIKSAVITGPTGEVGHALCDRLLEEGCFIYAVVHKGSNRIETLPENERLQLVFCDISDYSDLPDLIANKADAFYHLAWTNTANESRNDVDLQMKNIQYTIEAVRAARRIGCKVFIGAGSQAEYGRAEGKLKSETPTFPENAYGMAKLCAGQMSRVECNKLGIDHIWCRILSVYGPYINRVAMIPGLISKLLQGEKPALTSGEQLWDFLYSEDAADALYRMAVYGVSESVYPLGDGYARPLREYIEIIRDKINKDLPLGFGEIPYSEKQIMHLEADISLLKEHTGFVPKVSFEEGITKTIDWFKNTLEK